MAGQASDAPEEAARSHPTLLGSCHRARVYETRVAREGRAPPCALPPFHAARHAGSRAPDRGSRGGM
eukprot:15435349-Alexandrium_andersonii.AAC.1